MSLNFTGFRQSCPPPPGQDGIHAIDINDRIIQIYEEQSRLFRADRHAYEQYWALHPSFCAATKCADGRVYFPCITQTPAGLVKPFRAIGGRFEAFWTGFLNQLNVFVNAAAAKGSSAILFATYHFSESTPYLGCKGWKFDTAGARAHMIRFCRDLSEIYQEELTAIPTGIETDRDNMILHGANGRTVSGEGLVGLSPGRVKLEVRSVFPHMSDRVVEDLLPFLLGNAKQVHELTDVPRSLDERGHSERIIAVGRGFSGLARANLALMQNPDDPNLDDAIVTQAEVIADNIRHTHFGDDATLFTCMTYAGSREERPYREAKISAFGLQRFAQWHIQQRLPTLWQSGRLHHLVGIVHEKTKQLEVLEDSIRR